MPTPAERMSDKAHLALRMALLQLEGDSLAIAVAYAEHAARCLHAALGHYVEWPRVDHLRAQGSEHTSDELADAHVAREERRQPWEERGSE